MYSRPINTQLTSSFLNIFIFSLCSWQIDKTTFIFMFMFTYMLKNQTLPLTCKNQTLPLTLRIDLWVTIIASIRMRLSLKSFSPTYKNQTLTCKNQTLLLTCKNQTLPWLVQQHPSPGCATTKPSPVILTIFRV